VEPDTEEHALSDLPQIEYIGIDTVEPHPKNPRVHDLDAIAGSLERFGQTKPIIVQRSTGYVVAGNGTRLAAKEKLGWEEIGAVVLDMDDETADAYLAADNRTSDRAKYDSEQLFSLLEGIDDLDGTGFDIDYVETLGDALGGTTVDGADTGAVVKQPPPESGAKTTADKPRADKPKAEPMRDIVMLMTVSRAQAFGEKVQRLQKSFGTSTVVDTVERAIDEAVGRI
jgi:hypothetical protein